MKEKLTKNLALKLISLFCAFFVWLAVVNIANPAQVGTKEVPVTVLNPEVLEKANLTYEIIGKKTAVISYKVKTKDAYKIKASDFKAYADLSEMYDVTGAIPIKVEVLNNEELLQTAPTVKSPEVIKIKTEELQTKSFKVQPYPYGQLNEAYQAGSITISPDEVEIKGPVSLVGQISTVGIEFSMEGASSDISGSAVPTFFDANGNSLSEQLGESVKVLGGEVSYNLQVLKVKTVPLDFVVTGEVAQGYRLTGIEASFKNVSVAGLKSDLASISMVTIQDPELNIDGATSDKVCEIDLKNYIDKSLTLAGMEDTKVIVTLKVEPLREKAFAVEAKDIALTGRDDKYSYTISSEKTEARIRGLKEDLDSLSTAKMNIQADVSGLQTGSHVVKATLQLDDAFEIITYPELTVNVAEKTAESKASSTEDETDTAESTPESKTAESKSSSESKAAESKAADN